MKLLYVYNIKYIINRQTQLFYIYSHKAIKIALCLFYYTPDLSLKTS